MFFLYRILVSFDFSNCMYGNHWPTLQFYFLILNLLFLVVSPSNSLQDISPPVTPINVSIQNSSPRIAASPVISTRSPVLLAHQRSPVLLAHQQSPSLQNQSPVQPNPQRHLTTHHGNSSTPPPPPPPLASHTSAAPTPLSGTTTQAHCGDSSIPNSSLRNDVTFSRLAEDASFNGIHVLSQTQLHPLQQATLLQVSCFFNCLPKY